MKLWQIPAAASGTIVAVMMAFASVSYNATLGDDRLLIAWIPVSHANALALLGLAFDLGMIASVFGFFHWRHRSIAASRVCAVLFVIASLFSIHSVRGYIAMTITSAALPAARQADLYASLKADLVSRQQHLDTLRKTAAKERNTLERAERAVQEARNTLAQAEITPHVNPLDGFEWFLAIVLWLFNATCFFGWFGVHAPSPVEVDSVTSWLGTYRGENPARCTILFDSYAAHCAHRGVTTLPVYAFYARLSELGCQRFRDGRNGPTCYHLPAPDHVSRTTVAPAPETRRDRPRQGARNAAVAPGRDRGR